MPGFMSGNPATKQQIKDAEEQLEVTFSSEYKTVLSAFGFVCADSIELFGISKSKHNNIIYQTFNERDLNKRVPNTMYVIENAGIDGIIIWQDSTGSVYMSRPFKEPKKIASSLEAYLKDHLKNSK